MKTMDLDTRITKKQIVWLSVRIIGTLAIFNSLRFVFTILENLLLITNSEMRTITISQGSGLVIGWTVEAIAYFAIGLYLLLNGTILFDLLNRESSSS